MTQFRDNTLNRRFFLTAGAALGMTAVVTDAAAQVADSSEGDAGPLVDRNISSFAMRAWQDHFPDLRNGAILADTAARAVHFWSEDAQTYRLFPSSVPVSQNLTRLGRTEIVRKAENPPWRPTPSMRERFPDWPEVIPGGDPGNPLGVRALYLSWPAYLVHGTHDTRKIGRQSSDGCIGLYNHHIRELYDLAQIGTQVLLI